MTASNSARRRVGRIVLPTLLPVVLLVLWEVVGRIIDNVYFPPLSRILETFPRDWFPDVTVDDLVPSLVRFGVGYVLGSVAGIMLGVAIGASKRVAAYMEPTLEFLRAIPAVAVVPIAVLLFGLGDSMRISVIVFGVVFPVLVNTTVGVTATRTERIDVARMYGLSRWAVVRRVMLPSALPMISAGLRIALPIALIMMIVSELIGGQDGIGFYLQFNQDNFDIPAMFSAILVLGVLGNLLNALYSWLESRWLHWADNL